MEIWFIPSPPPPSTPTPPTALCHSCLFRFSSLPKVSSVSRSLDNIYARIIHNILSMIWYETSLYTLAYYVIQLYSIILDNLWDAENADLSLCEHQISKLNWWDKLVRRIIKARSNTVCMDRVCYGPSLCRPTLLWAEFAMGRVCFGPRCPVTHACYYRFWPGDISRKAQETQNWLLLSWVISTGGRPLKPHICNFYVILFVTYMNTNILG